ncbi:MAG: hypothetical protein R3335_14435, partial [Anaerolineales bacterium]|nr:hypothetical protein [Anaerolineales bacterium]
MTERRFARLRERRFYSELIKKVLSFRYAPILLALLGTLTVLPSITQGMWGDDLIHRAWLLDRDQVDSRLIEAGLIHPDSGELGMVVMNLFAFTGPGFAPDRLLEAGVIPWWTPGGTSISFWRPLSALTHYFDYALWPDSIPLMHLHNLLWFGALIFAITVLYRRLISPAWVAGLAAFLFLIDDAFYLPVLRVSQRNIQIALLFGVLAIYAHYTWRRFGSRKWGFAAPIFLLLSLLGSESGIATAAYLFSYEVFLGEGSWKRRIGALLPAGGVIVGWRAVYTLLGYGVLDSGLYTDPIRDPLQYALGVLERGPILLFGQLGFPPSEVYSYFSDPTQLVALGIALLFLLSVAFLLYPLMRSDRVARFWTLGMLLSVIPATAISIPSQRLLFFVGLGAMGLLGIFLGGLAQRAAWVPVGIVWRRFSWVFFSILLVIHIGIPVVGRSAAPIVIGLGRGVGDQLLAVGRESELKDRDLILVNSPSPFLFLYFPFERAYHDQPIPRETRILAPAFAEFAVTRTSENEIVLWVPEGDLFTLQEPPRTLSGNLVFTLWRANDTFQMNGITLGEQEQLSLSDV